MSTEYTISDGFKTVKIETVTTSTKYLEENINLLGKMYDRLLGYDSLGHVISLNLPEQQSLDALIHWLTEIKEQAVLDDTVILKVLE
jgi:hypothetical protein